MPVLRSSTDVRTLARARPPCLMRFVAKFEPRGGDQSGAGSRLVAGFQKSRADEINVNIAKNLSRTGNPCSGTTAKARAGMMIDGRVLVRLNSPRSRPRRAELGSTRSVCPLCNDRNTVVARPKPTYATLA